ncbi:MAG: Aldehyde Dehydrogenase, partial [Frankiales bacterium]|nr:Aldehyde Dehydrogenase [Frankiales bacterium]
MSPTDQPHERPTAAHPFDYAPAPESRDAARLKPSYGVFVNGVLRAGGGESVKTINPADELPLAEIAQADADDVDQAVAAARAAYEGPWSATSGAERAKYLYRIGRVIAERSRELAVLETLDNGKPISESRDIDVPTAAAHFFYYAGWADKLGYANLNPSAGARPGPVGVAGQVIPWNFPLLMAAWKIAPALAAGNTVVLKPAPTTPLTALTLAEIIAECDLPPGVVNILPGGPDIGQAIVDHPGVDKIAFTGSTAVGKGIAKSVAVSGKRLSLELGGKGANIVFDDAPISEAVEGIVNGIFFNQGQVCCAGSRLLVQESIQEELLEALKQRLAT